MRRDACFFAWNSNQTKDEPKRLGICSLVCTFAFGNSRQEKKAHFASVLYRLADLDMKPYPSPLFLV